MLSGIHPFVLLIKYVSYCDYFFSTELEKRNFNQVIW